VLLIKPIAALSGSTICRHGFAIYVDSVHTGDALPYDHLRRPMPDWQGCRTLGASDVFLMNPAVRDSFDGRYFGPLALSQTRGRAVPLLTFPHHPRT
jgi:type IV secretory pathway protease TraF